MEFIVSTAAVCFIACHGGAADHFATFAKSLSKEGETVDVFASGPALKKFQERGIEVKQSFSADEISAEEEDLLAAQIAKACLVASVVITDVGHSFDIKIQKALAFYAPEVPRFAYYDNPESCVPGGYSAVAAEVMMAAQGVLFSNANLAKARVFQAPDREVDFGSRKKIGIGYCPITQAEKVAKRRESEQAFMRAQLFLKNGIEEKGQRVLVYFGGNNEEYFSKAFPAFLSIFAQAMQRSDFANLVIVIQQHPGAKAQNLDKAMVLNWMRDNQEVMGAPKIILSDVNSEEAQVFADGAMYYQTSMGPQFLLAGIPVIQIGHETYADILVRNNLCPSVTEADKLEDVICNLESGESLNRDVILGELGIKSDWLEILKKSIK